MNEMINYLINYLLNENPNIKYREASNFQEKFNLYRSLSNIRPAKAIDSQYIEIENKFLKEYTSKYKQSTSVNNIQTIEETYPENRLKNPDKICIWQGDITTLKIDAIVNAANSQGLGCFIPCHNCIDNQINTYAGVQLRLECDKHMKKIDYNLKTGNAFTTNGYNLPADNVIHTVGPIISTKVTDNEKNQLKNCYINTLLQAEEHNIKSVAFCSISTGVFHFPKELASEIAIKTVDNFLEDNSHFDKIVFNVYGKDSLEIYENKIKEYI